MRVDIDKYTLIQEPDGRLHALRHGLPWGRDLAGDNLVLALAQEVERLRQQRAELLAIVQKIDSLDCCDGYSFPDADWPKLWDALEAARTIFAREKGA